MDAPSLPALGESQSRKTQVSETTGHHLSIVARSARLQLAVGSDGSENVVEELPLSNPFPLLGELPADDPSTIGRV